MDDLALFGRLSTTESRASRCEMETRATLTFESIYEDNVDFVWRNVRRLGISPHAAEDAVQSVFLVVHRRLEEFEGLSSIRTWLFSIILRVVQEHRRTLRRKSPHLLDLGDVIDPSTLVDASAIAADEALARAEAARLIERILDTLDDDKRVVFVLAELERMSAIEIGDVLGIPPKAVYSRLRAARTDFERAATSARRHFEMVRR